MNTDYPLKKARPAAESNDLDSYFRSSLTTQLFVDKELSLLKFSQGAAKLINIREADLGKRISQFTYPIRFGSIAGDIPAVFSGTPIVTKEIGDDKGRYFRLTAVPYIRSDEKKPQGAILTLSDISELKAVQAELEKKNAEVLRLNADLDTFVYGASHDLLGPLSNIQLSLSVLNEEVVEPALKKFVDSINSSVKKYVGLIRELSKVGKVESDMLDEEEIDLDGLLNEIIYELTGRVNSTRVIETDFAVRHVRFSRKNLRRILYNLLDNAIKFSDPGRSPRIQLRTAAADGHILLSVKDNGIGIPSSQLQRVFTKYARVNPVIDGDGIGLYLAKKIVESAGGRIEVESESGVGSVFTLFLKTTGREV